jgi:hypothetical protein
MRAAIHPTTPPRRCCTRGCEAAMLPSYHPSQALLHDEGMTEFCIVTIPTGLAIAESERLLIALEVSSG